MKHISDVLKDVFARIEKEKTTSRERVDDAWHTAAGERAFSHSRPLALRKSVLSVRVDSAGWMHELSLNKRTILKRLKSVLGKDKITEIHFKPGDPHA